MQAGRARADIYIVFYSRHFQYYVSDEILGEDCLLNPTSKTLLLNLARKFEHGCEGSVIEYHDSVVIRLLAVTNRLISDPLIRESLYYDI